MTCDLCQAKSGRYTITRTCCALRLVKSTPRGAPRTAMWSHLAASLDDQQWQALRREAEAEGLLKAKAPA